MCNRPTTPVYATSHIASQTLGRPTLYCWVLPAKHFRVAARGKGEGCTLRAKKMRFFYEQASRTTRAEGMNLKLVRTHRSCLGVFTHSSCITWKNLHPQLPHHHPPQPQFHPFLPLSSGTRTPWVENRFAHESCFYRLFLRHRLPPRPEKKRLNQKAN